MRVIPLNESKGGGILGAAILTYDSLGIIDMADDDFAKSAGRRGNNLKRQCGRKTSRDRLCLRRKLYLQIARFLQKSSESCRFQQVPEADFPIYQ